jgi:hypothetical protein
MFDEKRLSNIINEVISISKKQIGIKNLISPNQNYYSHVDYCNRQRISIFKEKKGSMTYYRYQLITKELELHFKINQFELLK